MNLVWVDMEFAYGKNTNLSFRAGNEGKKRRKKVHPIDAYFL